MALFFLEFKSLIRESSVTGANFLQGQNVANQPTLRVSHRNLLETCPRLKEFSTIQLTTLQLIIRWNKARYSSRSYLGKVFAGLEALEVLLKQVYHNEHGKRTPHPPPPIVHCVLISSSSHHRRYSAAHQKQPAIHCGAYYSNIGKIKSKIYGRLTTTRAV